MGLALGEVLIISGLLQTVLPHLLHRSSVAPAALREAVNRYLDHLCRQTYEAWGIVISQDGKVRFSKRRHGRVTYGEPAAAVALKIS
jgi:hypothetical protein